MDIVDQITAAIDGTCACGCGVRITDRSPSAYYATEGCHARWIAKQRGADPPPPPPYPGAATTPPDDAADDAAVVATVAAVTDPLRILFRQGYRLALPGSTAPWLRRCGNCGHTDTPIEGRRVRPLTFGSVMTAVNEPEPEPCNLCFTCGTPAAEQYLTALWLHIHEPDIFRLLLLAGERYSQHEVSGDLVHDQDRQGLVHAWRRVEHHLLRDLAPRCQHTAGCTEPARDRYDLQLPIHWLGTWHTPGRALLLCGRHGAELMRHVYRSADPVLGPYAAMSATPYQREPLDWTRA